jgi:hypothetical protein
MIENSRNRRSESRRWLETCAPRKSGKLNGRDDLLKN